LVAKQTKELAQEVIKGANSLIKRAGRTLTLAKRREDPPSPDASFFPLVQVFTGLTPRALSDLEEALSLAHNLIGPPPAKRLWLPYLGETLDAGVAALMAMEVLEFLSDGTGSRRWLPRTQEYEKMILGGASVALVLGAGQTLSEDTELLREVREKYDFVFMAGAEKGETVAKHLEKEAMPFGWENGLIFLGPRTSSISRALGFFARIALSEGLQPGQARETLQFVRERVDALMMALGEPDRERYAAVAGAVPFGIQTAAAFYIPQLLPIYPLP
jgi:acetyl-CoA synthase